MAKSGVERKNYIQKIEGKYEKYLEKQRKPMKNYKAEKNPKSLLVFLIVNVL